MASQSPTSPPSRPEHSPPAPTNGPPPSLSPPPQSSSPPSSSSPPKSSSPPPASSSLPNSSSSPPSSSSTPESSSPPPPRTNSPSNSSAAPPPSDHPKSPPSPATNAPPPQSSKSSESPPPPVPQPPNNASPPPSPKPPGSSPPPTNPSNNSPPPSPTNPLESSPPPPSVVPPPTSGTTPTPPRPNSTPESPPPSDSSSNSSLPPSARTLTPPPSIESPLSLSPPPSRVPRSVHSSSARNAPQNSHSKSDGGISTGATVAIGTAFGLILLGIFGIAAFFVWKRKKSGSGHKGGYIVPSVGSPQESDSSLLKMQMSPFGSGSEKGIPYSPHAPGTLGSSKLFFTYEELDEATNGFSAQNLLGEGGFGSVYKGTLADGRDVAVKQLKIGGQQGEREFRAEVKIINHIHHRHLVSLVGYCIHEKRRLLVYDYVPNNNLYFHLHGEGALVLDWATRVKIAVGAARGIAYLHEDCHPRIIHRDIKSSNILLDDKFEAQVSDFGLAKLAMDVNTHVTTRVMGTFGYMAPEYASTGKLTEKSDVYSYGVVLLELITGCKPVDSSQFPEDDGLVEWVRPLLNEALETLEFGKVADPRLEQNYVASEMFKMVEVAAACVRHSSTKRPKMGQVVRALDSLANSDLTNGMKVGDSKMFNGAQQSAEIRLLQKMAFENQYLSTEFFNRYSSSSEGNHQSSQSESSPQA